MVLTVPAKPDWALVLRMAVAGVGGLYDLPVDLLEDLRTAIDESCELLLHQDYAAETLTLRCQMRADGLHVCLSAQERSAVSAAETADADISRLIIGTLVKEVSLEQDESGVHCVHMTLPAKE